MLQIQSKRKPMKRPSRSRASSPLSWAARPWWSLTMVSKREPTHFTGLPSFFAASITAMYSGYACERMPKPPPTSSACSRTLAPLMPRIAAKFGSIIDMPCELA